MKSLQPATVVNLQVSLAEPYATWHKEVSTPESSPALSWLPIPKLKTDGTLAQEVLILLSVSEGLSRDTGRMS